MRPFRTRERTEDAFLFRTGLPHGVLVPADRQRRRPGIWAAAAVPVLRPVRRLARSVVTEVAVFLLVAAALAAIHQASPGLQLTPPGPPQAVCQNASLLTGPSTPPPGATIVPAGDNEFVTWDVPNTTFWFAPGVHTMGTGIFNAINPGDNSQLIGAPGAVVDGEFNNSYAVVGQASDVTVEYLTFQDFLTPVEQGAVDHNGGPGWTIKYNTITNVLPGTGAELGTDSVFEYNCVTGNGQQGLGSAADNHLSPLTGGPSNLTIDYNEFSFNDVCNIEGFAKFPVTPPANCLGVSIPGCGCTAGAKMFQVNGGQFIGNYVHDNYATGAWWDTNNTGWDIEDNYFSGDLANAISYEISYNARIVNNTFIGECIYGGNLLAPFQCPAVEISNSGSDPRLSPYGTELLISGNSFYNDWGGIYAWQDANRFCGTPVFPGPCTIVNPNADLATCRGPTPAAAQQPIWAALPAGRRTLPGRGSAQGQAFTPLIFYPPYYDDCQWKTENVQATDNFFFFNPDFIEGCTVANGCGINGLFSTIGTSPPYTGDTIENNLTFSQNNLYSDNTYCGPWAFNIGLQSNITTWDTWTGAPYGQDTGSTLNGPGCTPNVVVPGPPRAPVPMPVQIPIRIGRR